MASKIVHFTLNGRETEVMVKPLMTLQSLLREQLGYTATKAGCKQGGCGSCTVLLNDMPVMACLMPVEDVAGRMSPPLKASNQQTGYTPSSQLSMRISRCNAGSAPRG